MIDEKEIIYNIPSRYISCRFIRIHITDVADTENLSENPTGVIINDIFGEDSSTDLSELSNQIFAVFSCLQRYYI